MWTIALTTWKKVFRNLICLVFVLLISNCFHWSFVFLLSHSLSFFLWHSVVFVCPDGNSVQLCFSISSPFFFLFCSLFYLWFFGWLHQPKKEQIKLEHAWTFTVSLCLKYVFVFYVSHLPMFNALVLSCRQIYDYIFLLLFPCLFVYHLICCYLTLFISTPWYYWFGVCRISIAIKHDACDPGRDD